MKKSSKLMFLHKTFACQSIQHCKLKIIHLMTSCTMLFLWNPPSSIKVLSLMSSRLLRCSTTRGSYVRFSLVLIASSTNQWFVYCQWVGNENIKQQYHTFPTICEIWVSVSVFWVTKMDLPLLRPCLCDFLCECIFYELSKGSFCNL